MGIIKDLTNPPTMTSNLNFDTLNYTNEKVQRWIAFCLEVGLPELQRSLTALEVSQRISRKLLQKEITI